MPTFHWETPDSRTGDVVTRGEGLTIWPPAPHETSPTWCVRVGPDIWIWQPGVGGLRFTGAGAPDVFLYPLPDTDRAAFELLVARSWLPVVYPFWGRQVLHASAVTSPAGHVIAFTGPSGAGKSTLAYGMATRAAWSLVADDTLVFSCGQAAGVGAAPALFPLRTEARLRQATAEYFGRTEATEVPFEWPDAELTPKAIYALDAAHDGGTRITRLRVAEAYTLLLAQAHAMTLTLPEHNQRLMRDYAAVAAAVPVFRFSYARSFEVLAGAFDALEAHAAAQGVRLDGATGNPAVTHDAAAPPAPRGE